MLAGSAGCCSLVWPPQMASADIQDTEGGGQVTLDTGADIEIWMDIHFTIKLAMLIYL